MVRAGALIGVGALTVSLLPAPAQAAAPAQSVSITTDRQSYPVAEGSTAQVGVKVTTSDGRPLAAETAIGYRTAQGSWERAHLRQTPAPVALAQGTATEASDYGASAGTLTFRPGTPSGTTRWLTVATRPDQAAETAETIPLLLQPQSAQAKLAGQQPAVVINANGLPYLNPRLSIDRRVADLLSRMTLTEKIGQMTQAERAAVTADPTLIAQWQLGSVLSGGGSTPTPNTPAAWVEMVNTFQTQALSTRLQIPLIYGIDAVHGHGNVNGATVFPHNVGLGATRDPALVEQIGHATAEEVRATGIPWNFAPCACVSRDERWGRSYESFGEDPALVSSMQTVVDGLQGRRAGQLTGQDRVLATVKHYAGDGDTRYDPAIAAANVGLPWFEQKYPIDQGITVTSRAQFARTDLAPYAAAIGRHGAGAAMPSYSSVDWTEDGLGNPTKMHASRELITGVLKGQLDFRGFVVSDWEGIHQIPDPANPTNGGLTAYKVRVGVNAGTDMFMEPNTAPQFEDLLLAEVNAGRVSQARIDDAVRRILRQKFQLGLFEQPFAPADNVDQVGSAAHRALARQAVAQSQVLLKNDHRALPLRRDAKLYVAGRNADDIGNQAGGWTITWQGQSGDTIPGTTILEGIRQVAPSAQVTYSADASAPMSSSDVGVVVVGETPYSEGYGDVGGPECGFCTPAQMEEKSLALQPGDRAVIDKVCAAIATCVVLVVSGRPQIITDQLGEIDALVASWLPGSEGAGVADVLFGRRPFTGRLATTWPRSQDQVPINVGDRTYRPLYPFGWGLRTGRAQPEPGFGGDEHAPSSSVRAQPEPGSGGDEHASSSPDSAHARLQAAVAGSGAGSSGSAARAALAGIRWNADGSVREAADALRLLGRALPTADGSLADEIVSVARDLAQDAVVAGQAPADWASLIADADHALLTGHPAQAYPLLVRAAGH